MPVPFILLIYLVLMVSSSAHSQYFVTGQDPGSTKWRQIKTQDFQVIYPDNYSEWAQYYINVLSLTGPINNSDYKSKVKRISVILHNQTTTSNAIAGIAPMRLDLFEMSGQNTYPQIWQDQLALHEYRHTIQQFKLRQGLNKRTCIIYLETRALLSSWVYTFHSGLLRVMLYMQKPYIARAAGVGCLSLFTP